MKDEKPTLKLVITHMGGQGCHVGENMVPKNRPAITSSSGGVPCIQNHVLVHSHGLSTLLQLLPLHALPSAKLSHGEDYEENTLAFEVWCNLASLCVNEEAGKAKIIKKNIYRLSFNIVCMCVTYLQPIEVNMFL